MFLDSGLNTGVCSCAGHRLSQVCSIEGISYRGFIIIVLLGFWMLDKLSISIVIPKYICSVIII
jgi:hypothetical protein